MLRKSTKFPIFGWMCLGFSLWCSHFPVQAMVLGVPHWDTLIKVSALILNKPESQMRASLNFRWGPLFFESDTFRDLNNSLVFSGGEEGQSLYIGSGSIPLNGPFASWLENYFPNYKNSGKGEFYDPFISKRVARVQLFPSGEISISVGNGQPFIPGPNLNQPQPLFSIDCKTTNSPNEIPFDLKGYWQGGELSLKGRNPEFKQTGSISKGGTSRLFLNPKNLETSSLFYLSFSQPQRVKGRINSLIQENYWEKISHFFNLLDGDLFLMFSETFNGTAPFIAVQKILKKENLYPEGEILKKISEKSPFTSSIRSEKGLPVLHLKIPMHENPDLFMAVQNQRFFIFNQLDFFQSHSPLLEEIESLPYLFDFKLPLQKILTYFNFETVFSLRIEKNCREKILLFLKSPQLVKGYCPLGSPFEQKKGLTYCPLHGHEGAESEGEEEVLLEHPKIQGSAWVFQFSAIQMGEKGSLLEGHFRPGINAPH